MSAVILTRDEQLEFKAFMLTVDNDPCVRWLSNNLLRPLTITGLYNVERSASTRTTRSSRPSGICTRRPTASVANASPSATNPKIPTVGRTRCSPWPAVWSTASGMWDSR